MKLFKGMKLFFFIYLYIYFFFFLVGGRGSQHKIRLVFGCHFYACYGIFVRPCYRGGGGLCVA